MESWFNIVGNYNKMHTYNVQYIAAHYQLNGTVLYNSWLGT
jgi:hypothetical protein